jgi:hypothetical protein
MTAAVMPALLCALHTTRACSGDGFAQVGAAARQLLHASSRCLGQGHKTLARRQLWLRVKTVFLAGAVDRLRGQQSHPFTG